MGGTAGELPRFNTPPPFLFLASNKVEKATPNAPGLSQGDLGFQGRKGGALADKAACDPHGDCAGMGRFSDASRGRTRGLTSAF